MATQLKTKAETHTTFLKNLRDDIVREFETLENKHTFERECWEHHSGGGGEISVIHGDVFEKAAVNFSAVSGDTFPGSDGSGPFFATGVSLITHMQNPKAPTVHFNIRYIETETGSWFGGGYDLTPMGFPFQDDTDHFHNTAKSALGDPLYSQFSQNAREYFYIPHWKKERGVGGIFFDHYNTGDEEADTTMWRNVGTTFLDAIMPIYHKRIFLPYSNEDRKTQLHFRGHYVEFNLLYDRGTKFGFNSGGNPKAILCSMPPLASWA